MSTHSYIIKAREMGGEAPLTVSNYVARGAKGIKLMGAIHKFAVDDPMVIPFVEAARDLGAERVVFGSNLPEYRPIQVKRAIERLHLGSRAEELIFGANLARIYGM